MRTLKGEALEPGTVKSVKVRKYWASLKPPPDPLNVRPPAIAGCGGISSPHCAGVAQ
jgi:hypothetical protein